MTNLANRFMNIPNMSEESETFPISFEKCLLCNVICRNSGCFNSEEKILFCRIFKVMPPSLSFENSDLFGSFCQLCSSNVAELCHLEKQMCDIKTAIDEMQVKIANCVVNSFATTSCNQNGYFIKRQIYERWFERCHQFPTNIWESTPMPVLSRQDPVLVRNVRSPGSDEDTQRNFDIRVTPVEKITENSNDKDDDNISTSGNFPPSPLHKEDTCDSVEVVFTPSKPVLPIPCVIKKVKKSKKKHSKKKKSGKKKRKIKQLGDKAAKTTNKIFLNDQDPHSPGIPQLSPISIENYGDSCYEDKTADSEAHPSTTIVNSADNNGILSNIKSSRPDFNFSQKRTAIERSGPQKHYPDRFTCTYCQKKFTQKCNFDTHVRLHTGEKPYKCKVCDREFSSQGNKISHEATHDKSRYVGEPQFQCELCNKKFRFKKGLCVHKLRNHNPKSGKCELCGAAVSDRKIHVEKFHTVSDKRPCKCPTCHFTFADDLYLQMHQSVHSSESLRYQCKICRRGWKERSKLNQHLRTVHSITDLSVNIIVAPAGDCLEKMENKWKRVKLKRKRDKGETKKLGRPRILPEEYMCEICGKVSKLKQTHLIHLRWHSGEKPYKCRHCDRSFNDRGNRLKHEVIHEKNRFEGEPKFECKVCGNKFHLRQSLYVHTRKNHLEVTPKYYDKQECDICGAILRHHTSLVHHKKRWHSKEKNPHWSHQCTICLRGFSNETSLKVHRFEHEDKTKSINYKCSHCPPSSNDLFSKEELYEHYKKSHVDIKDEDITLRKTYKCPNCPQSYFLLRSVLRHIARDHENVKRRKVGRLNRRSLQKKKTRDSANESESETEDGKEVFDSSTEEDKLEMKINKVGFQQKPPRQSLRVKRKQNTSEVAQEENFSYNANRVKTVKNELLSQCKDLRIILNRIDEEFNDFIEIKEEIDYF